VTSFSTLQSSFGSHKTVSANIHGVTGNVVGTTDNQVLQNKTLDVPTISGAVLTSNLSVNAGITIDGRRISSDGTKLDSVNTSFGQHLVTSFANLNTSYGAHLTTSFASLNTSFGAHLTTSFASLNTSFGAHLTTSFSNLNTSFGAHLTTSFASLNTSYGAHLTTSFANLQTSYGGHVVSTTVHGVTGNVVGTSAAQTLQDKTLSLAILAPKNYGGGGGGIHYSILNLKTNASNPNYQVDIDADSITLFHSTDNSLFTVEGIDLTVDITKSGVSGLDTGVESNSVWYYLWTIYNPTTANVAGLLSRSHLSPALPSGYTYQKAVGSVWNDSASNFKQFQQWNDYVENMEEGVFGTITNASTGWTTISLSAGIIPALSPRGNFHVWIGNVSAGEFDVRLRFRNPAGTGNIYQVAGMGTKFGIGSSDHEIEDNLICTVDNTQQIDYVATNKFDFKIAALGYWLWI
jgi:hypothetical protein